MSYVYGAVLPDEETPRIEDMNAAQVRKMMCAKSGGNFEACKNCAGFKTCRPGQRMAALMAQQNKWKPVWNAEQPKPRPEPKDPSIINKEDRQLFRAACESGNAWNYLMETKSLSKEAAGELLHNLIKRYPAIAAEFGGGRRITQRPRVVKIVPMQQEPKPEPTPQPEQPPKEPVKMATLEEHYERLAEKARKRCEEAVASGDPKAWLMATGIKPHSVTTTLVDWSRKYPDLMAGHYEIKYTGMSQQQARELYEKCMASDNPIQCYMQERHVKEAAAVTMFAKWEKNYGWQRPERKKAQPEGENMMPTVHEGQEQVKREPDGQEDQISLADFLAEFDIPDETPQETAQNKPQQPQQQQDEETPAQQPETQHSPENGQLKWKVGPLEWMTDHELQKYRWELYQKVVHMKAKINHLQAKLDQNVYDMNMITNEMRKRGLVTGGQP